MDASSPIASRRRIVFAWPAFWIVCLSGGWWAPGGPKDEALPFLGFMGAGGALDHSGRALRRRAGHGQHQHGDGSCLVGHDKLVMGGSLYQFQHLAY